MLNILSVSLLLVLGTIFLNGFSEKLSFQILTILSFGLVLLLSMDYIKKDSPLVKEFIKERKSFLDKKGAEDILFLGRECYLSFPSNNEWVLVKD